MDDGGGGCCDCGGIHECGMAMIAVNGALQWRFMVSVEDGFVRFLLEQNAVFKWEWVVVLGLWVSFKYRWGDLWSWWVAVVDCCGGCL